jgi:hypothetical protein
MGEARGIHTSSRALPSVRHSAGDVVHRTGTLDDWNRSALEAAQVAMKKWVRVQSNRSLGAYEIYEAAAPWGDPEWPDVQFKDLLKIAFKDRLIDTADHPVLKRLRGEA